MEKENLIKTPNPQGKGLTPMVSLLYEFKEAIQLPAVQDDSAYRIFEDYLGSLLVLSCEFKFKPIPDCKYFIYFHKERLILSLIGPEEGGEAIFETHLGSCMLKNDLSWSVECTSPDGFEMLVDKDSPLKTTKYFQHLQATGKYDSFLKDLTQKSIGSYNNNLGYYQNVLNFMMGKTIAFRAQRMLHVTGEKDPASPVKLLA